MALSRGRYKGKNKLFSDSQFFTLQIEPQCFLCISIGMRTCIPGKRSLKVQLAFQQLMKRFCNAGEDI